MTKLNDAFWRWFGDSVVTVDGKPGSKPLVVFHGTRAKRIDVFEVPEGTELERYYFTDDEFVAKGYGPPMEVYLRIENPERIDMDERSWDEHEVLLDVFLAIGEAKESGRDGVILENFVDTADEDDETPSTVYVVFSPKQIKSVNNRGTWDSTDPDIRHNPDRRTCR